MRRITRVAIVPLTLTLLAVAVPAAGGQDAAERGEILTVEGNVQPPVRVDGPEPAFPTLPKAEQLEGFLVVRLVIEKDGSVSEAEVLRPLGEVFDAAAVEALTQWTFEPATRLGEPVRVRYHVTVRFALDDQDEWQG